MGRYRILLMDADNTLLDFGKAEREALIATLRESSVEASETLIRGYSEINDEMWKRLERGEIDKISLRTERFRVFCSQYGIHADPKLLAATYLQSLAMQSFPMEGVMEVCATLARHCRLYIVTNGISQVQHGRLDHSPLRPYFEDVFISDELGVEKPHKAFFDRVAALIPDFDPSAALVVGDSLTSDMAGGIGAGLDTCWFNPAGKPLPEGMPVNYVITRPEELLPLVIES